MIIKLFIFLSQLFCYANTIDKEKGYSSGTADLNVQKVLYSLNNKNDFESNSITTNYFKNLSENFGLNINGSCTYVAMGMLLSYYDSIYDDQIIDERFERKSLIDDSISKCESPGILSDSYSNYFQNAGYEWGKYIEGNKSRYFDYYLISKYDRNVNSYNGFQKINPVSLYDQYWNFRNYFLMDRGLNNSVIDIIQISATNNQDFLSIVKNQIANKIPVMLNVQLEEIGGHTVIAYDYDDKTDSFIVHTGWKRLDGMTLSCVTLKDLGCSSIESGIYLEYRSEHNHCNNYIKPDSTDYCICEDFKIIDIFSKGNLYRDILPSFNLEMNFPNDLISSCVDLYKITLKTHMGTFIDSFMINSEDLSFSLPNSVFSALLSSVCSEGFILGIETTNLNGNYFLKNTISFSKDFFFITETKNSHLITYKDYGFSNAYVDDAEIKNNYCKHTTENGFTFYTKRFRTGRPTYDYVTLSPRRKNYTEAYIEYYFERCIDRFDIQLSIWSTAKKEHIGKNEGDIKIQVLKAEREYYDLVYLDAINVLEDGSLTENKVFRTFQVTFNTPANVIRVYTNTFTESQNSSNNLGRVCIGDIYVFENKESKKQPLLPTSGSELAYDPVVFNAMAYIKNCYCYAFNILKSEGFVSPGNSCGLGRDNTFEYYSKFTLEMMTFLDSLKYEFYFRPIDKFAKCSEGHYKVALVANQTKEEVDGKLIYKEGYADYHWYRQNPDGTWSHKPGRCLVRRTDYNCNVIMDPENCVRKSRDDLNYNDVSDEFAYDVFIGFYEVSPFLADFYEDNYSK